MERKQKKQDSGSPASPPGTDPFSFKAILLGTCLCLCIALGAPYGNMVVRGSYMALDFSTPAAIFLFFIRYRRRQRGSREDTPRTLPGAG